MKSLYLPLSLLCILMLAGCAIPRMITTQDGLTTTVIDAATREPIADAFAFARLGADGRPIVLGRSDERGRLTLPARQELAFVPLLGEAHVWFFIRICKDGYNATEIITRAGWNADLKPPRQLEPAFVSLAGTASELPCHMTTPTLQE